ncbi:ABC transporter permease [Aureivirga marina]|uniref:ABC transporter permease n=1 Tax=Aureivirga marina TaxID=1182451 RepID=UPI0018C96819|nr:ABC transporter permease [Aureivirga marina]
MEQKIIDLSFLELLISIATLLIPFLFFWIYKIRLIKSVIISVIRMIIQLTLVAIYLEWIFDKNNAWINSAWILVMLLVSVFTTIRRAELHWKNFAIPLFISGFTTIFIIDAFFLGYIIKLKYIFDAQYLIPISGMLLGNALNNNIIGLNSYYKGLKEKEELYQFLITNTGNKKLALQPFLETAIRKALNPMIATISVLGLISLPGMMTGQILGGVDPSIAIKYQFLIMIAIFVGCTMNLFLSIILANKNAFDSYDNFKSDEIVKEIN